VLDAEGVHHLEPGLSFSIVGGIHYPQDAHLIPDRFLRELARCVEGQGVRIELSTEVLGFELSQGRISAVSTTRGTFQPDQVILAAGAWSPVVARELKMNLPIQAAKGYSVTVARTSPGPTIPLHLAERKVVVTPMGDTLRFAGTLELTGLNLSISRRRVTAIQRAVHEYLPHMSAQKLIEVWRGLRPLTPDTLPIIGRSKTVENLILATGHGMLGVSLGPVTGKLVSQIAAGEPPLIDLHPFRAERF
jgi:D-amino-acid dehydrogenase